MGFLFSKNKKNRNEENTKPEKKNTNENKDIKRENPKPKPSLLKTGNSFDKNKKNLKEEKPEIKKTNEITDRKRENPKPKSKPKQSSVGTKIKKPSEEPKKKNNENILPFNFSKYINPYNGELRMDNSYLAKDIENEYIIIQSDIQQLCLEKDDDDEEMENEFLGKFLYKLKKIALDAYISAKDLEKGLFKEFQKNKAKYSGLKEEECKTEFSSWIKNSINEKQLLENFCKDKIKPDYNEEDKGLFFKLTSIYFKCLASSETIDFRENDGLDIDFNSEEMIDLAQIRGNKKKVNFEVLPGLYHNGQFFQKGKIHVFAYIPGKTFKLEKKINYFKNSFNK
jgi:hypothetical protein